MIVSIGSRKYKSEEFAPMPCYQCLFLQNFVRIATILMVHSQGEYDMITKVA